MKPEIKVTREWSYLRVRSMCIRHEYYTYGDNEDYTHMLEWVQRLYPNAENLYFIAEDIRKHSSPGLTVESIMYDLERETVTTYFKVNV